MARENVCAIRNTILMSESLGVFFVVSKLGGEPRWIGCKGTRLQMPNWLVPSLRVSESDIPTGDGWVGGKGWWGDGFSTLLTSHPSPILRHLSLKQCMGRPLMRALRPVPSDYTPWILKPLQCEWRGPVLQLDFAAPSQYRKADWSTTVPCFHLFSLDLLSG